MYQRLTNFTPASPGGWGGGGEKRAGVMRANAATKATLTGWRCGDAPLPRPDRLPHEPFDLRSRAGSHRAGDLLAAAEDGHRGDRLDAVLGADLLVDVGV